MGAEEALLAGRLASVRERIGSAARRAGRDPAAVRLVVATKTAEAGRLASLPSLGCRDLGENRVQEALGKIEALAGQGLAWHLIGHLQRNKARLVPGRFAWVHSIDSLALAQELSRRADAAGARVRCLVEVNVAAEPQKHGMPPAELPPFLDAATPLPGLSFEGLMTVAPFGAGETALRRVFAALRGLAAAHGLPELSMGMSDDLEIAVEEGATMVRIGRAILGDRS